MDMDAVFDRYRVVLKEKYARMDSALETFRRALPELLRETDLPTPKHISRAGIVSVTDLTTAMWKQDVALGTTMETVRIEWTLSLSGFHFTIRERITDRVPVHYQCASRDFTIPREFVDKACALRHDRRLPFNRWEAHLYTY